MSFWDNVKKFTQPYSDDDYDEYDDYEDEYEDEMDEPTPRTRRAPLFGSSQDSDTDFGSVSVAPATTAAPAASTGFSGSVLHPSTSAANKQEVVLFHAKAFDDAAKAADELRHKKAVILNMENVDKALTRRVVDFLSGCVYAVDGQVKKIAQCTYLFCPHGMGIVGDLESFHGDIESYI